ncbi:MAG TPA: PhoPQ-activated protein PqaA family protein [Candidatus Hydrogenedentes bacterium]|nr:PhoPQ-activated protein PqaA family protein [Candidatus Hydrogenedentota bacterium]
MRRVSSVLATILLACIVLTTMAGCPKPPNYSLALIVAPTTIDFGAVETVKTFRVSKVYSSRPMAPISVAVNQPWLSVTNISPASGVSAGPSDYITVTVTIDRTKMNGGLNTDTIVVSSSGLVPVKISVLATLVLKADFKADTTNIFVNQSVSFQDLSKAAASEGPILTRLWSFGDGSISVAPNPVHTYLAPGTYTVRLTVATANNQDTIQKDNYITVSTIQPPRANFTFSPASPDINQLVRFTDTSQAGSLPITKWSWDFGDGKGTSTSRNPSYTYTTPGAFNVMLRITAGPDTSSVTKTVSVTVRPPVANFSVDERKPTTGQAVHFTDLSDLGSGTIATSQWSWNFGDPTDLSGNTSTQRNPQKAYSQPGNYSVSMTVTTPFGTDNELKANYIRVFQETALDRYVKASDIYFSQQATQIGSTIIGTGFTAATFELASQSWREYADVNTQVWRHHMTLIRPTSLSTQTALLYITGGTASDLGTPPAVDANLAAFATTAGAPVAVLTLNPYQPIVFKNQPSVPLSEDSLIAASLGRYLDGGDEYWPALLPMTKAAVKAMNVAHDQFINLSGGALNVNRFIVTGAAKRGWVAWLTAAVDSRVAGIAPLVFDGLNLNDQLLRHYRSYGAYDPVWGPYLTYNVIPRLTTTRGLLLLQFIDPQNYQSRLDMPKLLLNPTGDTYFLPDAARSYWGNLLETKHLRYFPQRNANFEPGTTGDPAGYEATLRNIVPWFLAVANGNSLPTLTWTHNNGTLTVQTSAAPRSVTLWQATTGSGRDFRGTNVPWGGSVVQPAGSNTYSVTIPTPTVPGQYTAFFIEVRFPSSSATDYVFTTQVYVLPDALPFSAPPKAMTEDDGLQDQENDNAESGWPLEY